MAVTDYAMLICGHCKTHRFMRIITVAVPTAGEIARVEMECHKCSRMTMYTIPKSHYFNGGTDEVVKYLKKQYRR